MSASLELWMRMHKSFFTENSVSFSKHFDVNGNWSNLQQLKFFKSQHGCFFFYYLFYIIKYAIIFFLRTFQPIKIFHNETKDNWYEKDNNGDENCGHLLQIKWSESFFFFLDYKCSYSEQKEVILMFWKKILLAHQKNHILIQH